MSKFVMPEKLISLSTTTLKNLKFNIEIIDPSVAVAFDKVEKIFTVVYQLRNLGEAFVEEAAGIMCQRINEDKTKDINFSINKLAISG